MTAAIRGLMVRAVVLGGGDAARVHKDRLNGPIIHLAHALRRDRAHPMSLLRRLGRDSRR
jgi:hypothetical protein